MKKYEVYKLVEIYDCGHMTFFLDSFETLETARAFAKKQDINCVIEDESGERYALEDSEYFESLEIDCYKCCHYRIHSDGRGLCSNGSIECTFKAKKGGK